MSPKPLSAERCLEAARACVDVAGATDRGEVRARNEDSYGVFEDLGLYLVADGVAGRAHGDVASRMAVDLIHRYVDRVRPTWPTEAHDERDPLAELLAAAVRYANRRIFRDGLADGEGRGMTTTFVGVLVEGDKVCLAHVGDSRAYRLRRGHLEQLTVDHSLGNEMAQGRRPGDWLLAHVNPAALTRAVGLFESVDVTLQVDRAEPGDILLLCSDGLTNMIDSADIAGILGAVRDLEVSARALIATAKAAGGLDNITVVLVRWDER